MKPWMIPFTIFLCTVLLMVLGEMRAKYEQHGLLLEECWGQPKLNDCTRRCARTFKCVDRNRTCCWTYCGNICWENKKSFIDC